MNPNIRTRPEKIPRTTAPALGPELAEPTQAVQPSGCSTTTSTAIPRPGGPVLPRRSPCRWLSSSRSQHGSSGPFLQPGATDPRGRSPDPSAAPGHGSPRAGSQAGTGGLGTGDGFGATWGPQRSTSVHGWCSNRNCMIVYIYY